MSPARRAGAAAPALRAKLVLAFYVLAAALLPLVREPRLRVFSHLVLDIDTAEELDRLLG